MTLEKVNDLLLKIMDRIEEELPELEMLEIQYWEVYHKYLLNSNMGNAAQREAEAKERLAIEYPKLKDDYLKKKLDIRILLNKKEILIEVSRNLRSLEMARKD